MLSRKASQVDLADLALALAFVVAEDSLEYYASRTIVESKCIFVFLDYD